MCETSPLQSVVLNVGGPGGALYVHQHSRLWTLQLNHHYGLQVSSLVGVGVKISREASEWGVAHLNIVIFILFDIIILVLKLTGPMFSMSAYVSPSQ